MTLLKEIEQRRSFRAVSVEPIREDVRIRLMSAAEKAPSCSNNQPWRYLFVQGAEPLEQLKSTLTKGNYWAAPAPLIVAVITDESWDERGSERRDYALFDTGMSVMNLLLQAQAEGLTAHPIAGFDPVRAKEVLGIPSEVILVTLIVIGHPGSDDYLSEKHRERDKGPRLRKDMVEVFADDVWNEGLRPKR